MANLTLSGCVEKKKNHHRDCKVHIIFWKVGYSIKDKIEDSVISKPIHKWIFKLQYLCQSKNGDYEKPEIKKEKCHNWNFLHEIASYNK